MAQAQLKERIIVLEGNQALANTALAGANIYTLATRNFALADKQGAIVYADHNRIELKNKAVTAAEAVSVSTLLTKKIEIVQGTPWSGITADNQNAIGINDNPDQPRLIRSGTIDFSRPIRSLGKGNLSKWERYSAFYLSGITAASNRRYKYRTPVRGVQLTKTMSAESLDQLPVQYTTGDITGVTSAVDLIYKNLAKQSLNYSLIYRNNMSNTSGSKPFLVLGICDAAQTDPTFNGVTYVLPTVSQIMAATYTSIVVAVDVHPISGNAIPINYTVTPGFRTMLIEAVANGTLTAAGADKIGIINLSQAGTSTSVNAFKGLLFTSMETAKAKVQDESMEDRISTITVNCDKTADLNNSAATMVVASTKRISQGKGEALLIRYNQDADFDLGTRQVWGSSFDFIQHYKPVNPLKWYTVYEFESEEYLGDYATANRYSNSEVITVRTVILVESSTAPSLTTDAAGVTGATTKAGLTTFLAGLLDSAATKLNYYTFTFN